MFTLIIGGAGSGKSEYAESHVLGLDGQRLYLATMEPFGAEAEMRIARHRRLRRGKGFLTLERFVDIGSVPVSEGANVLLEDLGNLLANEMYSPAGGGPEAALGGLLSLGEKCRHLTVVTNEIGLGGVSYEGDTLRYMEELGRLNCCLAARADLLVEVLCGIPRARRRRNHAVSI
ncbi:MAG: bifunctional adenosylcobinamide kinase/adenosylcobinamide-phosphate guanylyltransferase [Lachnospiraceae bacterium]|nr:bifunctional adenosylcobinamide kinase/adenosylcobinamide-phosphate guanylyltransferase [Lachnospiraceae bacterium]